MAVDIYIPSEVTQTITDGVKTTAPSEDAVFIALALKANSADLALVATTGDYNDLDNLPIIPDVSTLVPYTGATQNVDLGEFELKSGQVEFDQTPTGTAGVAVMRWNNTDGTVDLGLKGGNVTLQVGQEQVLRVVNKTATNINLLEANYQAVRVTGAQGQRLKVDLALATNDLFSAETIGLVTETINNNQEGFITTSGLVRGINTTGSLQTETWADGDVLYLSPTTAGNVTKVKPTAPNHLVIVGYVVSAHITQGSIFVKVDNGYELDELHNVLITSVADNNLLQYDSATSLWKNESLSTAGIQPTLTSGTNIKTINGNTLLGSGDLVISGGGGITVGTTAVTSGTIGRVFFQGTGDVVQQSASLFWDNTNARLGVGATPSTAVRLDVRAQGALSTDIAFRVRNSADTANILQINGVGQIWANGKGFQTQNTAFGQLSLNSCTTGNNNTAFGYNSLAAVTTATTNTGFGSGTLQLTTGEGNTGIGFNAGRLITTGTYNTCIGYEAGSNGAPTAGVYIGSNTGATSTGLNVVAIGAQASQGLTSGSGGIAIGYLARIGTIGAHNISLGQSSGLGLTTGSYNIHLGYRSVASGVATGNYNTLIGGDSVIGDVSNNAILSDAQGNQAIRKDTNHNVLLGREVALATNATNGFAYLPTCAGVPTGVPSASFTGKAPVVIDSTNNKMYIYTNAAWVALN